MEFVTGKNKMVMAYTKKQFIEDVKKEARALRGHATKEELEKLDFNSLDARSSYQCIYGQITGNCTSKRAHQLISKCCTRLIDFDEFTGKDIHEAASVTIDRPATPQLLAKNRDFFNLKYISSIEGFIMLDNDAKNKNLIAYLKGETNDLVL
jgi:hypothetical protein